MKLNLAEEVEKLRESWINGNRKWVIDQVLKRTKAHAAHFAAALAVIMEPDDRERFAWMLSNRIK